MKFEWDTRKADQNLKKHKVTFDPDHSEDEHRQILIGHSYNKKLLFVVHIAHEEKNVIRIISARKATKKERHDFENL